MATLMPRTSTLESSFSEESLRMYFYAALTHNDTVGRRTGFIPKKDIRKDALGFDDLDDFWNEDRSILAIGKGIADYRLRDCNVLDRCGIALGDRDDHLDPSIEAPRIMQAFEKGEPEFADDRPYSTSVHDERDYSVVSDKPKSLLNNSDECTNSSVETLMKTPTSSAKNFTSYLATPESSRKTPESSFDETSNKTPSLPDPDSVRWSSSRKSRVGMSFSNMTPIRMTPISSVSPVLFPDSDNEEELHPCMPTTPDGTRFSESKDRRLKRRSCATSMASDGSYAERSDESVLTPWKEGESQIQTPRSSYKPHYEERLDDSCTTDASFISNEDLDDTYVPRRILSSDSENEGGRAPPRRSRRKKFKPLEWYKGEHLTFERRESGIGVVLPTVTGVKRDGTGTPRPQKKARKLTRRQFTEEELPQDYDYNLKASVDVWDENEERVISLDLIRRKEEVKLRELSNGGALGLPPAAGQVFKQKSLGKIPSWISGNLELPPGAAKEVEESGSCTQVFNIVSGQAGALEVAFAKPGDRDCTGELAFHDDTAQRYTLSPGDHFFVPPKTVYMLQNHSEITHASITFTILRPLKPGSGSRSRPESAVSSVL